MTKKKFSAGWFWFVGLCLLGGLIFLFPSYRFSGCVILALAGTALCFLLLKLLSQGRPKLARVFRRIVTVCICLVLVAAIVTGFFIAGAAKGRGEESCDYLIVLGAGVNGTVPSLSLRERLDAAYDYLQAHPETVCVVSGGQGSGESITEAACMADWLTAKGIPPERILVEDRATSTQENLAFSIEVIFQHTGSRPQSVGIISSEYHLYRAGLMAREQNLQPILIPARTTWLSLRLNYFLREIVGVWYYLIFG